MRLQILILITEFGLSCYMAARVLNLPYTNAKVIYRVFRDENRVTSNARAKVRKIYGSSSKELLTHHDTMKDDVLRKLEIALHDGTMTNCQRTKIYDSNFDTFFSNPLLSYL